MVKAKFLKTIYLIACIFNSLFIENIYAQDVFSAQRAYWLEQAEKNKPELIESVKYPIEIVSVKKDSSAYQGWRCIPAGNIDKYYNTSLKTQPNVVADFGNHMTGYFSFTIEADKAVDAPVKIRFTFAEAPAELGIPFDPYHGTLSRGWLQDEIITLDQLPATVTLPRRYAFRYVRVELQGSSPWFDIKLKHMECKSLTSSGQAPPLLNANTSALIKKVDQVSLKTLSECMQTVFEDGPKRDRRLWIGDFYLQSLTNNYSFKNFKLSRRCLYLLAGLASPDGFLPATVFESPNPHAQENYSLDYALLFNLILKEYLEASNDYQTAKDLWPVAVRQLEIAKNNINAQGIFEEPAKKDWWLFFDWNEKLDKQVPLQGLIIHVMQDTYKLAQLLEKESDVSYIPVLTKKMMSASKEKYFDKKLKVFVSGPSRQVSYASQIYMILSGVVGKEEGKNILKLISSDKNAVYPVAPYLYHYYVEALLKCGMNAEAKNLIVSYWGSMVNKGADTFWEVYDPSNPFLAPFPPFIMNSYCHAWSCTPSYYIRKYPAIFQN